MKTINLFMVLMLIGLLLTLNASEAIAGEPDGLVLWNKLGSDEEVLNSEIGENGILVGTPYAYEPAKHGNGYVRKGLGAVYVEFPGSVIHNLNERGTIELWIVPKVPHPVAFQYGVFGLVGHSVTGPTAPDNRGNVYLFWGDGVTGRGLYGAVRFDDAHAITPSEPTQFVATPGVPFHAAIAWDIDGIDGTDDKVRVYRDGEVVGSTTVSWNPNGTDLEEEFHLGAGPDAQGFDKFISDNIKVWNYAKTDFSDRFEEEPTAIDLASFSAQAGADGVTLAWETATEIDNAGFNLYRAASPDGPWTQINDALIVAQGEAISGASYNFVDTPGYGTFYYQLEDVDFYGISTIHGPVWVELGSAFRVPRFRPTLPEF